MMRCGHPWTWPLGLVVAGVTITACTDGNSGSAYVTVRDSAGITIVEHAPEALDAVQMWSLSPQPVLRIGELIGEAPYLFNGINSVLPLSDGRLVIGDRGSMELRYFSADGTHLFSVGGKGDGPGEFQLITGPYLLPGDSVGAVDAFSTRYTTFGPEGQLVGTFQLDELNEAFEERPNLVGVSGEGGLIVQLDQLDLTVPGLTREKSSFYFYATHGAAGTEIGTFPGLEFDLAEDRSFARSVEMARSVKSMVAGNHFYVGATDIFEVRLYTLPQLNYRIVRVRMARREISPDIVVRLIAHRLEALEDIDQRNRIRESLKDRPFPPEMPQYEQIRATQSGEVWIQEYHPPYVEGARRWWIFGEDGQLRAGIETPPSLTVDHVTQDRVYGHERDELDVERVVVYEIMR